jgi:predicted NAD-dependent protein-ADP-ribosyltransferase YbiA (DUF1768 family)
MDWLSVLAMPTDQIIRERLVGTDDGSGVLWASTPLQVRELSALGAIAWDANPDRPEEPRYEWAGFNLLCNAAPTPFTLGADEFRSVDSFYEALKLPEGSAERQICASAPVQEAKRLGRGIRQSTFSYRGQSVRVGSPEHEAIVAAAVSAKVSQNPAVQVALRGTGAAKLVFPLTYSNQPGPVARVTPVALMIERWKLLELTNRRTSRG